MSCAGGVGTPLGVEFVLGAAATVVGGTFPADGARKAPACMAYPPAGMAYPPNGIVNPPPPIGRVPPPVGTVPPPVGLGPPPAPELPDPLPWFSQIEVW